MLTDLIVLLLIFLTASVGSRWMMYRLGYGIPATMKSREAIILITMKILLMSIWALVMLVILWLIGINPLHL